MILKFYLKIPGNSSLSAISVRLENNNFICSTKPINYLFLDKSWEVYRIENEQLTIIILSDFDKILDNWDILLLGSCDGSENGKFFRLKNDFK